MNRPLLEAQLAQLPIAQYEFFKPEELEFSHRIRTVCREECPRYGKTWACPPGVGTVEACKARCLSYSEGLLISTMTEVSDLPDMAECLATRGPHEVLTRQVRELLRQQGLEVYALSTESCALCESCSYPDAPCRHEDKMLPCVESHGIIVTALAEACGIDCQSGSNLVTWFSLLLFREAT
ncbi:MAG: DUF2284 domain-containing protein [Oscillospiraceae bacterium]|nr:DUF2284 domain-containing protein [Oscillospiraceae bacterium]